MRLTQKDKMLLLTNIWSDIQREDFCENVIMVDPLSYLDLPIYDADDISSYYIDEKREIANTSNKRLFIPLLSHEKEFNCNIKTMDDYHKLVNDITGFISGNKKDLLLKLLYSVSKKKTVANIEQGIQFCNATFGSRDLNLGTIICNKKVFNKFNNFGARVISIDEIPVNSFFCCVEREFLGVMPKRSETCLAAANKLIMEYSFGIAVFNPDNGCIFINTKHPIQL